MPKADLVRTGIAGLNDILPGGIPRGNVILVEGATGTGKTTSGMEFVYGGAREFDKPGVVVVSEVSPDTGLVTRAPERRVGKGEGGVSDEESSE